MTPNPLAPDPSDAAGSEQAEAYDALLARCLEGLEREGSSAVEALCDAHPGHAERLRRQVRLLAAADLLDVEGSLDELRGPLGDFVALERLGGGAMGVVHLARQVSTGRLVALKLVRPEQLVFGEARARFRREVELLARLHHPAILPVLAVGETRGVPWFAMELVRGASLAALVAGLRAAGVAPGEVQPALVGAILGEATPPALREGGVAALPPWRSFVLRVVREVALALAHAHERGVLHRDVKPSNVLVAADGRPFLADFGLAGYAGEGSLTRASAAVGSLPYMAPEVLAGEPASVRSDVYGLGALLYELLCLRAPFEAASTPSLVRAVLAGDPPPPRRLAPRLGADEQAVVLRALERAPERRYASAAELARDLEHLLERRPTLARPIGAPRRMLRAARRRPARAVALALGALVLVAGPLGWELNRQRTSRALERAFEREQAAHARSERHFRSTLAAVGHVLRDTASEELEDVPRMQRARLDVVESALEVFAELERDRPGDPDVRAEEARLHAARADVLYDLGRVDEALEECRHSAAVFRALLAQDATLERRVDLATALNLEGKLLQARSEHAAALAVQRAGLAELRLVCAADAREPQGPEALERRRRLVVELANLAESQVVVEGEQAAHATLLEAEALARELAAVRPGEARFLWPLGRVVGDQSELALALGERERAAALALEGLEVQRRAAALAPETRFYAFDVASALERVAAVARAEGAREQEQRALEEGLSIVRELLRDFPESARMRRHERALRMALANLAAEEGRGAQAIEAFGALLEAAERELARDPAACDLRVQAAVAANNLANALLQGARAADEVVALAERGLELVEPCRSAGRGRQDLGQLERALAYLRVLALCQEASPEALAEEIEAFEARGDDDPRAWRFAADLWNEWILAFRRAAGSAAVEGRAPDGSGARAQREHQASERMFAALLRAVERGYADLRELESTPALDSFRDDPRFVELLRRARRPAAVR